MLCFCLHVHNPRTSLLSGAKAIDWLGIVLILGLSLMILLGLNLGGVISPWGSPEIVCLVVSGGPLDADAHSSAPIECGVHSGLLYVWIWKFGLLNPRPTIIGVR